MQATFVFLGTGASAGVPVIGCRCPVCLSKSFGNVRLRSSGLLEVGSKRFVIDTGPDFREQALKENIDHLDGVLLTHTHFDHIAGIDDLRIYFARSQKPMPCLLSQESRQNLRERYAYLENQFAFQVIEEENGRVEFEGMFLQTMSYRQGKMGVVGYRFGDFAYVSDIRVYDEAIFKYLSGLSVLVLSALCFGTSHAHLTVEEAIEFSKRAKAQKTYLTHTSHLIDYESANRHLPPEIRIGYDGLRIPFTL